MQLISIKKWFFLITIITSTTQFFAQKIEYNTIYTSSFINVGSDPYNKELIKLSNKKPPRNWKKYKGGALHTNDTSFFFNNDLLCHEFPSNSDKINNKYLIFYFTYKNTKCPTLFSLLNYYQSTIVKALEQQQLPKELKFIPAVCSGFNPNSKNALGGVGYWHLYYTQAVRYGLTVNEFVDERKDVEKSSLAAALYLKDLYQQYKNWELTLAAYSSGVVNVNKLLRRHQTNSYKAIKDYLPKETKDFVQSYVALSIIYSYDDYGAVKLNPVIQADTVFIERKLMLKAINDILHTKTNDFQFLNPILNNEIFPSNFTALFPYGVGEKFIEMKDSIYFYQDSILLKPKPTEPTFVAPKDGEPYEYTVKSGDVLGLIASKFNVRVVELQAWNNLNGTRIDIGQKLMIYGKKKIPSQQLKDMNKPKEEPQETTTSELQFDTDDYTIYKVKSGDNLWDIAKKFPGISADNIIEFNKIDANIDVGQVLKIPKP